MFWLPQLPAVLAVLGSNSARVTKTILTNLVLLIFLKEL